MSVRAGKLRHRVEIQQAAIEVDANGDRTETWSMFTELYASIETGNGREYYAAKQTISDISHTLRMRFRPGIKPEMRVKYIDKKNGNRERYFNIRAVNVNEEWADDMLLQCTEKTF
jgi:SPP1 family predicted phage head-tail adaptor